MLLSESQLRHKTLPDGIPLVCALCTLRRQGQDGCVPKKPDAFGQAGQTAHTPQPQTRAAFGGGGDQVMLPGSNCDERLIVLDDPLRGVTDMDARLMRLAQSGKELNPSDCKIGCLWRG